MLKCFWQISAIVFWALLPWPSLAADPTPDELRQKFQETLAESRMALRVDGGRLVGPGAAFLNSRAAASQYVMIGEEHGVASIADLVRAWFPELAKAGFAHFALEADPYMTGKMEAALRSGGVKSLTKLLAGEDAAYALPFYSWDGEAELAAEAVRLNAASQPALWGLDQVFIGAYGYLLRDIAASAVSGEARAIASSLVAQAHGDLNFISKVDMAEFEKLRSLLGDPHDAALAVMVDDMIASARIYAPFIGKTGLSVYAANLARENLMKQTFETLSVKAGHPKVVFKFGSNHMTRGLSQTHVLSLASFVTDRAMAQGRDSFSVLVLCGPGTMAARFKDDPGPCDMSVEKDFPDLARLVDAKQPTLFNLAPWKDKPRRWEHLPDEVKPLIWAYDAILFVPNGKPSKMLN